jgi:hypothetical protein
VRGCSISFRLSHLPFFYGLSNLLFLDEPVAAGARPSAAAPWCSRKRKSSMKGLVFIELLKMAETAMGEDEVDSILETVTLPSGGVYTSVGYYDCSELVVLVDAFSTASGIARPELERQFGHWVMSAFEKGYGEMFQKYRTAFDMLDAIENEIHVEVRKLYPDAELPSFRAIRDGQSGMQLEYRSERPLANFCHGLVEACFSAYGEDARIDMEDASSGGLGHAYFHITKGSPHAHE